MSRKQFIFTFSLALLSGLIGGVLSIWFLMPPSVLAQSTNQDIAVGKITARSITLLDENGNDRISICPGGILMLDPQRNMLFMVTENDVMGTTLALRPKIGEKHGFTILVTDAASTFGPSAGMWIDDVNGKSVWQAP